MTSTPFAVVVTFDHCPVPNSPVSAQRAEYPATQPVYTLYVLTFPTASTLAHCCEPGQQMVFAVPPPSARYRLFVLEIRDPVPIFQTPDWQSENRRQATKMNTP